MPGEPDAARLAGRLKELRETYLPDGALTQAQLAAAFSTEKRVAAATISAWETANKIPPHARLPAYARFFATTRSLDGDPHLVPFAELTSDERQRHQKLLAELRDLHEAKTSDRFGTFSFDDGPVTVICPEAPEEARGPLNDPKNPNFTKLHQYADLDSLVEAYGHVRASNPELDVFHRIPATVLADDLTTHVVLIGGIAWNDVTVSFQEAIEKTMPIKQIRAEDLGSGEIFRTTDGQSFYPEWDTRPGGATMLKEDVALLARIPNPFMISRTLTICNGIHSRGVYGAVRCLTDRRVRESNEQYLAEQFPDGQFALLLRVPVVADETLSPDLQNPNTRLYEWSPDGGGPR